MPLTSNQTIEIKAPVECVWQVITDLARYGEWNTFVPAVESSLRPGEPIVMQVHVFDAFAQQQRETVLENVALRRLCYGVNVPAGALRSRRCHHLEPASPTSTSYRSEFELSGWLSPIVSVLMGQRLRRGFEQMAEGLQRQAEELARESSPHAAAHPPGDPT